MTKFKTAASVAVGIAVLSLSVATSLAKVAPFAGRVEMASASFDQRASAKSTPGGATHIGRATVTATLPFLANAGQLDARVAFHSRTFAGSVFALRSGELVYPLPAPRSGQRNGWLLKESFIGGRAIPSGGSRSRTNVSVLGAKGTLPAVAAVESVRFGEVWPGIAAEIYARGHNIEKVFTLAPGIDSDAIALEIDGATLSLARDGSLVATTGNGPLSFAAPFAYQEGPSGREAVPVRYRLNGKRYGFELGAFDRARPLVIDPIIQSTYIGGSGSTFLQEGPQDIAVHPTNGDVYVAGVTDSPDLPGVAGGAVPALSGSTSGFIARFSADLQTLEQATFFGGQADEWISSIVVTANDIYVSGYSAAATLPAGTTAGVQPTDPNPGSNFNGFIARLPLSLTSLTASTFVGGTGNHSTQILDSMLHSNGDLYVCGLTASGTLPNVTGGFDAANSAGNRTAFVARVAPALTAFEQLTYFSDGGITGATRCNALAAMPGSGEVVIGGMTEFGSFQPPNTAGGLVTTTTGSWLARFDEALTQNPQSTWLAGVSSGSNTPGVYGLRVHPSNGDLYVLTRARSDSPIPANATAGGGQATCTGTFPCLLVMRISPTLTSLVAGTFYGNPAGALLPRAYDHLAIDPAGGDVFVVSDGAEAQPNTAGGIQPAPINSAGTPGMAVRIRGDLGQIIQATYLSGAGTSGTSPYAAIVHPSVGHLYVAGYTGPGFPQTSGGAQPTIGSSSGDGFISRMTLDLLGTSTPAPQPGTVQFSAASYSGNENGGSVALTLTRTNGADGAISVSVASGGGSAAAGADYTALTQTVSWADGDTAAKTVSLAVLDDAVDEPNETVNVTLANATGGATLGTPSSATVTVVDDDEITPPPPPSPSPPAQAINAKGSYGGGAFGEFGLLALALLVVRRRFVAALSCMLGGVAVVNAAEPVAGPYAGLRAGIAESSRSEGDIERRLATVGHDVDVSLDDQDRTITVFGGYRWPNGLSIEASYLDLGEYKVSLSGETESPSALLTEGMNALANTGRGAGLTLGWQIALPASFAITPRIGMYYWESERRLVTSTATLKSTDSDTQLCGGIALEWRPSVHWSLGLNWDVYDAGDRHDMRAWTASVEYTFGR